MNSRFAILFIGGVILLFFWPALRPNHVLMPLDLVTEAWPPWQPANTPIDVHNDLLSDVVNYIYPVKAFVAEEISQGRLPLWNPYVALGYPLTYNTQAGIYYPLSLLMVLLPPAQGFDAIILVQLLLGGWFMFAYLRQLALGRLPALLGSLVFLFNGMMIVWLEWQVVHAAMIWLPLQLWGVEKLIEQRERGRAIPYLLLTAVATALPWLNGHWNWTLYGALTLGLYVLWRSWQTGRATFVQSAQAIALGIGLALIQLLPAVVYLAQSHRGGLSWAESVDRGLLRSAIVFLIPNFFGSPAHNNWWGAPALNFNEVALYLGILPLLLIAIALASRQHSHWRFFAAWGSVGLLWTLGTIAYRPLHALPVFNGLFPSRALMIVVFCASILSAIGLQTLLDRADAAQNAIRATGIGMLLLVASFLWQFRPHTLPLNSYLRTELAIFAAFLLLSMLLCAVATRRLPPQTVGWLAIIIVVADLYTFGHDYNAITTTDQLYPITDVGRFLQADDEPNRIATLAQGIVYTPNTSLVDRVENVSGYEPGVLSRVTNYLDLAEGESTVRWTRVMMPLKAVGSPLFAALNVKYIVTVNDLWGASRPIYDPPTVADWRPLPHKTTLTTPDGGLHRVLLPLRGAGEVTVRVVSADESYEFARATAIATNDETPTAFDFGAFPADWGRDFVVLIEGERTIEAAVDADQTPAITPYYLPRPNLLFENGKTRIYENAGYFPRAFAVHSAVHAADETESLALLTQHQARLDQLVILEEAVGASVSAQTPPTTPSIVTLTHRDHNRLTLRADMAAAGYVVLSDTYYAGWRATVDGEPADLYRANSVMRAVPVPAGEHTIEMFFRPRDFQLAAAVSVTTLLLCIALAARHLWAGRQ